MSETPNGHDAIPALLKLRGLGSIREIAALVGMAPGTVQHWFEVGHVPAPRQQRVIDVVKAQGIEIGPADFFRAVEAMTQIERAIEAAARAMFSAQNATIGPDFARDERHFKVAIAEYRAMARAGVRAFLEEMRDVAPATVTAILEEMK